MQIISSRDNSAVKRAIGLKTKASLRKSENAFICEGETLLQEAVRSGFEIERIFINGDCVQPQQYEAFSPNCAIVPSAILAVMSDIQTPQGPIFICKIRENASCKKAPLIVLEDVRDPGNMGTIIRTAEAFGVSIALVGNCVDIYSPKVVRATMGGIFRANIMKTQLDELAKNLSNNGTALYAAALSEGAEDIRTLDICESAVIIGNEAAGVSDDARARCRGDIIIPIHSAQSLNAAVAASIVMWQMQR